MATIGWSTSTPGDDSTASAVDNQIRSDLTAIQTGLQQFMWWDDGSANSDGYFKGATLRFNAIGRSAQTKSLLSYSYDDGWMWVDALQAVQNDPAFATVGWQGGGLYLWGAQESSDTRAVMVGHPSYSLMSTPPSTVSATWVRSAGTHAAIIFGSIPSFSVITFGVTYAQAPYVHVSWNDASGTIGSTESFAYGVDTISTTTARLCGFYKASILKTSRGYWQWVSEGTVTYG